LSKKKAKDALKRDQQRESVFQPQFREDLRYWVKTNRKIALRVFELIEAIMRNPFEGIGKPEPLKSMLSGAWSRRLTLEHRIVYTVSSERIDFLQCRFHY
jgi:toxin YoeB